MRNVFIGVGHDGADPGAIATDGESIIVTPDRWTDMYRDIKYIRVSGKWTGNAPEFYAE